MHISFQRIHVRKRNDKSRAWRATYENDSSFTGLFDGACHAIHGIGQEHYAAGVKSMEQEDIPSPVRKDKKVVSEGCGPVAGAMLLGYWQTERGKKKLLAKGFDGSKHPSNAIVKLYKEMKSKKAPGSTMSYTMPDNLYKALKDRVSGFKGLKADRKRKISTWSGKRKGAQGAAQKRQPRYPT